MKLSEELKWRGLIENTTFKNLEILDNDKISFYQGFDASADSQTIGNLAAMMIDLCFLRHGHKAIILLGGATSMIGDPGGKDSERNMQDRQVVEKNISNAKDQISFIFRDFDINIVNNIEWTEKLDTITFLRDIGKNFAVGDMIKQEYIKNRLGEGASGISFTEFSYSLLQAYDYLYLYDHYKTTLQIGGSDQWANCLAGTGLIRKKRNIEANVITLPLIINKLTGKKFGKSENGAIWLSKEKTSVFDFYQFWLGVDDEAVQDYVKIYTDIDQEKYSKILEEFNKDRGTRFMQKYLAYEVTKLVHGKDEADKVILDNDNGGQEYFLENKYTSIIEFLVTEKFIESKNKARELLSSGGIYINDIKSENDNMPNTSFDLRIGKKRFYKVIFK